MQQRAQARLGQTTLVLASIIPIAVSLCAGAMPHVALAQAPVAAPAQPPTASEDRLTQAQLEQLLAPIALYPDDLLMQVLMASTYPLEVVQAKRWLAQGQNAALRGEALAQALVAQGWDPSVKSLVPFPDVLTLMNDQLEWTQQLGDTVLAQQGDVLNAVQVLRGRAQASGALKSGPQQTVSVAPSTIDTPVANAVVAPPPQVITIAPANPAQVYVPAYNPSVVYGSWPYPSYPPPYYPPPPSWGVGNALLTGMAFAGGVAVVGSLFGWAQPGWGRGDVDVNVNRYNTINSNRNQISGNRWQHDPAHRHGVAYRNDAVRDSVRPGGTAAARDQARAREQFRGRSQQGSLGGGIGDRQGGQRSDLGDRRPGGVGDRSGGQRSDLGDRRPGGVGDRSGAQRSGIQHNANGRPQAQRGQRASQAPQGLQGMGSGQRERNASQRGLASREGQPAARARQHGAAAAGSGGGARAASGGGRAAHAGGGQHGGGGRR
jgi:hypothetical protein